MAGIDRWANTKQEYAKFLQQFPNGNMAAVKSAYDADRDKEETKDDVRLAEAEKLRLEEAEAAKAKAEATAKAKAEAEATAKAKAEAEAAAEAEAEAAAKAEVEAAAAKLKQQQNESTQTISNRKEALKNLTSEPKIQAYFQKLDQLFQKNNFDEIKSKEEFDALSNEFNIQKGSLLDIMKTTGVDV